MPRFRITSLIVLVALTAVAMAAFRLATDIAVRSVSTVTLTLLALGVLGVVVRRGSPTFVGFAFFGCAYVSVVYPEPLRRLADRYLITIMLVDTLAEQVHPAGAVPFSLKLSNDRSMKQIIDVTDYDQLTEQWSSDQEFRDHLTGYDYDALRTYLDQLSPLAAHRRAAFRRQRNARLIDDSLSALAVGLVGAMAGKVLALPRRHLPTGTA